MYAYMFTNVYVLTNELFIYIRKYIYIYIQQIGCNYPIEWLLFLATYWPRLRLRGVYILYDLCRAELSQDTVQKKTHIQCIYTYIYIYMCVSVCISVYCIIYPLMILYGFFFLTLLTYICLVLKLNQMICSERIKNKYIKIYLSQNISCKNYTLVHQLKWTLFIFSFLETWFIK